MTNTPLRVRTLDEWYYSINRIYLDRNFYRDRFSLFAHLVEVLGGLSLLASTKTKPGVTPEHYVPKALAWWMALCGKVGIRSVEEMLWTKFPRVCTYCHRPTHDDDACRERKASSPGPDWAALSALGEQNKMQQPRTLAEWQGMFSKIYPVTAVEDYPATIGRFTEELGELAEALRVSPVAPGYFLSEAADVFAWLMHLQNLIHSKRAMKAAERGQQLAASFAEAYPGFCRDCQNPVCTCPPILPGTLGRIAHEIPSSATAFIQGGAILTQEEAAQLFELGARTVVLGGAEIEATVDVIRDLHRIVSELKIFAVESRAVGTEHLGHLMRAIGEVEALASAQRLTQHSIDELASAIALLPHQTRAAITDRVLALSSSVWATALVKQVERINPPG